MVKPIDIVPLYINPSEGTLYADEGMASLTSVGFVVSSGVIIDGAFVHGALAFLDEDDHPQYLLVDGSRAMSGNLTVSAGNIRELRTETSDYNITTTDYTIFADATSNAVTAVLPASAAQGQIFYIKCINDTFTCTVSGNGNNIDGEVDNRPLVLNESITVQYDTSYGYGII